MEMDNWTACKLGDIAEIIMGQSPPGDSCNEFGNGLPLLNGPTEFGSSHPMPVQYTTDPRKLAKSLDLLFCVRGSTTGRMNWANRDYAIGRGIAAIRHREGDKYRHFVKGLIDCNLKVLLQSATGSTFPNVSKDQLNNLVVSAPSLETQAAIAEILSSLDDKIELNNQINQELEALAQALFKHWFIDFEFPISAAEAASMGKPNLEGKPYKSSGGEMVDSELGEIPKGWSVVPIRDTFEFVIGGDWGKDEPDSDHTELCYVIRGTDIPSLRNGTKTKVPFRAIKESKARDRKLQEGDIVLEISGGSNDQATGRNLFITKEILDRLGNKAIPASFCRLIRPKPMLKEFIGIYLSNLYDEGGTWEYQNQSTGISNFQFKYFEAIEKLAVPQGSILRQFNATIQPMHSLMTTNESLVLANLRDSLLPRLISGELELIGR